MDQINHRSEVFTQHHHGGACGNVNSIFGSSHLELDIGSSDISRIHSKQTTATRDSCDMPS